MSKNSLQIIESDEPREIDSRSDPEAVIIAASAAAKALQKVVAQSDRKLTLQGKEYLYFESWQTLGQFYSYTVETDAEPVEVDGVKGAKGKARVIDFRTGLVVGGAEAFCMSSEENWAGKPWFQQASMAQTRAASKALRNRLAWVAVLAGYEATPAEEMTGKETPAAEPQSKHFCQEHNVAFRRFDGKGDKAGTFWYSHKTDDGWCNEKNVPREVDPKPAGKPQPAAQSPSQPAPTKAGEAKPCLPSQIERIYKLTNEKHNWSQQDTNQEILDRFKCRPEELSWDDAAGLIKEYAGQAATANQQSIEQELGVKQDD